MTNTRIDNDSSLPPRHLAPLERSELRRERVRVANSGSLPCLAILAALGAVGHFVFRVPPTYLVAAAALIFALRWFIRYQSSSAKRRREITEALITRENRTENDKLVAVMQQLSSAGFDGYAITLGKFLQHKRSIEAELHKRPGESPPQLQVAKLVDSVCFGVAEQFQSVASIEERLAVLGSDRDGDEYETLSGDRRELLSQVIDAYKSLKRTRDDLPFILDPTGSAAVKRPAGDLQELIDQLREEEEIARNTRARLQRDRIDPDAKPAD